MGNIIKFPSNSKMRSKVTEDVKWAAWDTESYFNKHLKKNEIIEACLWDIQLNAPIINTKIAISDPDDLSEWRKDHGYTKEAFEGKPTMAELNTILSYILPSVVVVSWNASHELQLYPGLATISYDTKCCMKRFAQQYGDYSYEFNDRKFDKLKSAAFRLGVELEQGEFWHNAATDARVASEIWNHLNNDQLHSISLPNELILRKEAEDLFEEVDREVTLLRQDNLELNQTIDELKSQSEEDIPF